MLAGCLRNSGYWMGERVLQASERNPLGYFESAEINDINEALLAPAVDALASRRLPWRRHPALLKDHRWLACLDAPLTASPPDDLQQRMRRAISHTPYCFKDPRFSYTLLQWLPLIGDAVLIGVFREPARTVRSVLTECEGAPYLRQVHMTPAWAERMWCCVYGALLQLRSRTELPALMVHYRQIMEGDALQRIARLIDGKVDTSFPTPSLARSANVGTVKRQTRGIYNELCKWAEYDG